MKTSRRLKKAKTVLCFGLAAAMALGTNIGIAGAKEYTDFADIDELIDETGFGEEDGYYIALDDGSFKCIACGNVYDTAKKAQKCYQTNKAQVNEDCSQAMLFYSLSEAFDRPTKIKWSKTSTRLYQIKKSAGKMPKSLARSWGLFASQYVSSLQTNLPYAISELDELAEYADKVANSYQKYEINKAQYKITRGKNKTGKTITRCGVLAKYVQLKPGKSLKVRVKNYIYTVWDEGYSTKSTSNWSEWSTFTNKSKKTVKVEIPSTLGI